MASYQARQRDPLLDSTTQAILEQRGKELLGIGLIGLAVVTAMILGSYAPDDPSWLSATDEPAQNMLGRFGASVASPLFVIAGLAAWGFALVFAVWGVRLMIHRGSDQILPRIIFAPIAIALTGVYASTHVPGPEWVHSFGLGGLFGDTVLGAVLGVVPVSATFGLKLLSLVMAGVSLAMGLYVLGFTMPELRAIGRFLLLGIVMSYATASRLLGRGAVGATRAALAFHAQQAQRREARAAERAAQAEAEAARYAAEPAMAAAHHGAPQTNRVLRAEPTFTAAERVAPATRAAAPLHAQPQPEPEARPSLLARMPSILKRNPEPELVEPELAPDVAYDGDPQNRISAKIAGALRKRGQPEPQPALRDEPPLMAAVRRHRKGPDPILLNTATPRAPAPAAPRAPGGLPPAPAPLSWDAQEDEMLVEDSWQPEAGAAIEPEVEYSAPPVPPVPETKAVVQHSPRRAPQPSRQAMAEAQPALKFEDRHPAYEVPPLSLLANPANVQRHHLSDEALEENARMLENVLDDYGVKGEIVSVRPGPVVTMYELEPAPGLKASRVIGLADDIARSMSALSARVSTVPGRSVIGIELPNEKREMVVLREMLAARDFGDGNQKLPLALGKDIGGDPVIANLAKMPHLLIAGTTGSGKSVAINTMILSLLYKLTPEECRLIMIDPKMLELSVYDGIPHLLSPVVTDPKKAVVALKWVVGEMEERYRKMSKMGVRNIDGYNSRVKDALDKGEMFKRTVQTGFDDETGEPIFETEEFQPEKLPYIVVIVDEMADLMMVAGKEIEACIQRLAQMARASGIHLIMATQRPSVDVITGTIKANFPTRISFQVTGKIDSRTILGEQGAEQLLGMGDMLYMAGGSKIMRVHGPFVSDEEVEEIVNHLKAYGPPDYVGGVVEGPDEDKESDIDMVLGLGGNTDGEDALYDTAVAIVAKDRKCSTSYIQRKLAIGYNKAARLVEQMEEQGVVSPANHVGKREILVPEP